MHNVMQEHSVGLRLDGAPWQRVYSTILLAPRRLVPNFATDRGEVA